MMSLQHLLKHGREATQRQACAQFLGICSYHMCILYYVCIYIYTYVYIQMDSKTYSEIYVIYIYKYIVLNILYPCRSNHLLRKWSVKLLLRMVFSPNVSENGMTCLRNSWLKANLIWAQNHWGMAQNHWGMVQKHPFITDQGLVHLQQVSGRTFFLLAGLIG